MEPEFADIDLTKQPQRARLPLRLPLRPRAPIDWSIMDKLKEDDVIERCGGPGWSIHPGEILKEEFLIPLGMSERTLAQGVSVSPQRIDDITQLKTGISADMALRLGKFFNTSAEFWMNLQAKVDR